MKPHQQRKSVPRTTLVAYPSPTALFVIKPKPILASADLQNPLIGIQRRAADDVDRYLAARGIVLEKYPEDIRTCNKCRYDARTWFPAMVALVRDPSGKPVTLHRTFLSDRAKANVPNPRKLMPGTVGEGAAVRLGPIGAEMGVAEGIETALACASRFRVPVWSALNATFLAKWVPPAGVLKVHVFGDNHASLTGQEVAYRLGRRLKTQGFEVEVHIPEAPGSDWADGLGDY